MRIYIYIYMSERELRGSFRKKFLNEDLFEGLNVLWWRCGMHRILFGFQLFNVDFMTATA